MYVVIMRRWGGEDTHAYVIGVYTSLAVAWESGLVEEGNRGGKYKLDIVKCILNKKVANLWEAMYEND